MRREIQVVLIVTRYLDARRPTEVTDTRSKGFLRYFSSSLCCLKVWLTLMTAAVASYLRQMRYRVSLIVNTVLLVSCTSDVVPVDARLTISPERHSLFITEFVNESGRCVFSDQLFMDIPILLTLTTANSSPIGDAAINVYTDFSENTFSGQAVLALFDDINGNGVVDAENELISGANDDIASVTTDTDTGSRRLLLRINLSCAFTAELRAFSGAASSLATIEVLSQSSIVLNGEAPL